PPPIPAPVPTPFMGPPLPPVQLPSGAPGRAAPPAAPIFALRAGDTLGSLLPQGGEFAPLSAALSASGGAVSAPREGAAYLKSISSDGANGFHATYVISGEEIPFHFLSEDFGTVTSQFGKDRDDGHRARLWSVRVSGSGSFYQDPRDGGHSDYAYFDTNHWFYSPPEGGWSRAYSVYGVRTAPENLPATGTASYDGGMRLEVWNADDASSSTSRYRIRSRVFALEANFDDSEISGHAGRLEIQPPGQSAYVPMPGNSIAISGGGFEGSRFTADWTGEDTDANSAPEDSVRGFSGKMLGEFYGPAAEEVAGVINGSRTATATTPEQQVLGFFEGREQVESVNTSTEAFMPVTNAIERDHVDTMVRAAAQSEAYVKSIARDGAGGFHVTYVVRNQETSVHFVPEDAFGTASFRKQDGDLIHLLLQYNQFNFLQHVDVNGWIHHEGDDVEMGSYWGYSVHGEQTAPENLPSTGSATYKGRFRADIWSADDHDSNTGRTRFQSSGDSSLTLEANFGNGGISGRIERLVVRRPGESSDSPLADSNAIDISGGAITGNTFTANWAGEDTDMSSAPEDTVRGFSGTMNGAFYGPAAEEVGGLMNGSRAATATTPEQIVIGGFGAQKME
ncbi:MAG: transferrin-binding protein-like solute binding protein, partial [Nitrospinae bacterium]|nr:transferrin-binding protein-like solute binding protein [Nitrospinota bacterium]